MELSVAKTLWHMDNEFSSKWRRQGKQDFDFFDGQEGQWDSDDLAYLTKNKRIPVTFNRSATIINTIAGNEVQNRQEVRYFPVEEGDMQATDVLTSAGQWFHREGGGEEAESAAFTHALICGMGWVETTLEFDENPNGAPAMRWLDPLSMWWDCSARQRNLRDAKRVWYAREMTYEEARDMFPDAEDSDFHAGWTGIPVVGGAVVDQTKANLYKDDDSNAGMGRTKSTDYKPCIVLHLQVRERLSKYRIVDPVTQKDAWLDEKSFTKMNKRLGMLGMQPLEGLKQNKVAWMQYFIGNKILDSEELPVDEFTFKCMTGYQSHNKGTWYGMISHMRDPQKFANKWLSQIINIINTTAKGGVMAPEDVTADVNEFEDSFLRTEQVTWLKPGADPSRIQPKPVMSPPPSLFTMLEFAVASIRDVTGVNLEMLGMRGAIQASSLEQQRKEAGLTILAPLFDSLRGYRQAQGSCMLKFIQKYLADGRLIRIVGQGAAKYVPLALQADQKFDVIVDEAPVGPNLKEKVWGFIAPFIKDIPPQILAEFLVYSPLPMSVVEKLQALLQQVAQPKPEDEQLKKLAVSKAAADIGMTDASAAKARAEAGRANVEKTATGTETILSLVREMTGGGPNAEEEGGADGSSNGAGRKEPGYAA